ncbi:hypothetical protein U1Q18_003624, partial [Sarracenia purpurea var. burkii]
LALVIGGISKIRVPNRLGIVKAGHWNRFEIILKPRLRFRNRLETSRHRRKREGEKKRKWRRRMKSDRRSPAPPSAL